MTVDKVENLDNSMSDSAFECILKYENQQTDETVQNYHKLSELPPNDFKIQNSVFRILLYSYHELYYIL